MPPLGFSNNVLDYMNLAYINLKVGLKNYIFMFANFFLFLKFSDFLFLEFSEE